jgi:hypothetical protein
LRAPETEVPVPENNMEYSDGMQERKTDFGTIIKFNKVDLTKKDHLQSVLDAKLKQLQLSYSKPLNTDIRTSVQPSPKEDVQLTRKVRSVQPGLRSLDSPHELSKSSIKDEAD